MEKSPLQKPNSCSEEDLHVDVDKACCKVAADLSEARIKMRHGCKSHTRRQKRWSLPTTDAEYKGDQTNMPSMSYPEGLGARCGQGRCLQSTRCEKGMGGYASGRAASNTRCETPEADLSLGFLTELGHFHPDQNTIRFRVCRCKK